MKSSRILQVPKVILEKNKLILTSEFCVTDLVLLKQSLKKHRTEIHSVCPEGTLSITALYVLKKYLNHKEVEVPAKYREQWDMLDVKLPTANQVNISPNPLIAFKKVTEMFSLADSNWPQNRFWLQTFKTSFAHLAIDNASIVFGLFIGIGITLTFLSYETLFRFGIELESVKVAMLFGLKVFCPMMSVILLTAKSCTSSAAIVKSMWMNGDFKVMYVMNLPYKRVYLHPMFVACALAGPLVNLIAIFGTLVGACLSWAAKGHPIPLFFSILDPEHYLHYVYNSEIRAFLASTFAGVCMCVAGLIPGRDFQSLIGVIDTCIIFSFISNVLAQTVVSLF